MNLLESLFIVETSQDLSDVLECGRCVICGGIAGHGSVYSRVFNSRLPVCCPDHERQASQLGGK